MSRRRTIALVLALLAAAPGAASAARLGPAPADCTGEPDGTCLVRGGGGDVTVSPRIVQVGDTFTVTLTDNGGYGGPASWGPPSIGAIGAGISARFKLVKPGCVGRKVHKQGDQWTASTGLAGKFVCHYKALSAGRGWQKATVSFSVRYGGLASYSEDTFHVVSDKSAYVEGWVRGLPRSKGDKGPGIRGARVKARGPDGGTGTTNNDGYYAIEIKQPGRYEIAGELRSRDRRAKPRPRYEPGVKRVRIKAHQNVKDVNFRLTRGDSFEIAYRVGASRAEVSSAAADGVTPILAEIKAVDPNGDPLAGRALQLVVDGARLAPKAIVCQGGGRIWPSGIVGGARSPQVDPQAQLQTDSSGVLDLTVFPGTEPGPFELTVRNAGPQAKDSPEGSATLQLTKEDGADLASTVKNAIVTGVPGAPAPLEGSVSPNPGSANQDVVRWLTAAKAAGMLRGWDFVPVRQEGTIGPLTKYGVAFWRSGSPPQIADTTGTDVLAGGDVFTTDFHGLNPLRDGQPLEPLAAWGPPAVVQRLFEGYKGTDLTYVGWPYEHDPALACIDNGAP